MLFGNALPYESGSIVVEGFNGPFCVASCTSSAENMFLVKVPRSNPEFDFSSSLDVSVLAAFVFSSKLAELSNSATRATLSKSP